VFDRTPILLGAAFHLPGMRDDTIGITAKLAIYFLDDIDIAKFATIERNVIGSLHAPGAVHREINPSKGSV
jgi:hypothetical protein